MSYFKNMFPTIALAKNERICTAIMALSILYAWYFTQGNVCLLVTICVMFTKLVKETYPAIYHQLKLSVTFHLQKPGITMEMWPVAA
jgi:hypothetical protein